MKISKNRFDNVKKQVAQMVDKKEIIINDNCITLWGYKYEYVIDNNKIKVILNSYETFVLKVEIEEDNVIILESICNGKKCKSDRTLNKFSKIVSVFYPLYELGFIK